MTIGDITIIVLGPTGHFRSVKIAYNRPLRNLFTNLREAQSRKVAFRCRGRILNNDDVPHTLDMNHGDIIEIFYDDYQL